MVRFALRLFLAVLLLAGAPWCAAADAVAQPKGSLVIIGGNLRPSNGPVWERIIQLAGGKGARIAVFASASGTPERSGKSLVERLNSYGAKAFFVPVAVKLSGSNYQTAADDRGLADSLLCELGDIANFIGFLETPQNPHESGLSEIGRLFRSLESRNYPVGTYTVHERGDIWNAVRRFFQRQADAQTGREA